MAHADRYDYGDERRQMYRSRSRSRSRQGPARIPVRPSVRRLGAGNRARVTVETAVNDTIYQQGRFSPSRRRLEYEPLADERKRKRSRTPPYRRPQRPGSDVPGLEEDVSIRYGPPSDSAGSDDDLDFKLSTDATLGRLPGEFTLDFSGPARGRLPEDASQIHKARFNGQMTALLVSQSRWLGSPVERGELAAEISTMAAEAEPTEKPRVPLMKWCHLERSTMMNFEEFTTAVLSVLELPETELRDVSKLLRDMQTRFEKQRHHGRYLEPACASDVFYTASGSNSKQTTSVKFLCFPYFCLEKYSTSRTESLTSESPMHPLRAMLQNHFFSVSQERELAQAITRNSGAKERQCLHVSQVWAAVVDGSTMVTCSRLSIESLCGDGILQAAGSVEPSSPYIKVSISGDRSWQVPVVTDMSWPKFRAPFEHKLAETLVRSFVEFQTSKRIVDGNSWPELVEKARREPVELKMDTVRLKVVDEANVRMRSIAADPTSSLRDGSGAGRSTISGGDHGEAPNEMGQPRPLETGNILQLFKYIAKSSQMGSLADSIHHALLSNTRAQEEVAYKRCQTATATEIEAWLERDVDESSESSKALPPDQRKLASALKFLFCFFWPVDFEHPVTASYWGAFYKIFPRDGDLQSKDRVSDLTTIQRFLFDDVLPLVSSLAREFRKYEEDLRPVPEPFLKAWLHLVIAVVLMAETSPAKSISSERRGVMKHIRAMTGELEKGRDELYSRLRTAELDDLEVCTENSLLALVIDQLAQDIMHGSPDVPSSYTTYFYTAEFNITQDPTPRAHQETLRFFLQEVEAILATLESQMSVLDVFQQSLDLQSSDSDADLRIAFADSRRSFVINSCKARIQGRIDTFKGLQQRALDLGEWQRGEMDTNKDRQENAILIFTIVTIIFLPLSFVASVFGMNTNDIRNMPFNQWAYWAAGLPLTVVIVVGSLWFAGELDSLLAWLARTTSRKRTKSGYDRLSDRRTIPDQFASRVPPINIQASADRDYAYLERAADERPVRIQRKSTYPHRNARNSTYPYRR